MIFFKNRKKMTSIQQQNFFKILSEMLESGFNLKESLLFIKQTNKKFIIIDDILTNLENGKYFSHSIRCYINGELYNQIYLSEKNGNLIECLKEISKYINIKNKQNKKIKEILAYPIFLIMLLLFGVAGINKILMPQINNIAYKEEYNFQFFYFLTFLLVFALFLIIIFYIKQPFLKKRELIIKLPFLGKIYKSYLNYYLSYSLYLMLKNGIDIKDILNIMNCFQKGTINYHLSFEIKHQIENGCNYSKIINKYNFIPNEFNLFFSQGNSRDNLLRNLFMFSKLQFEEMINKTNRLINLIQPILFLIIGVGIVFSYLSILMPIYKSLRGI
ncbi:type II secretion system F family protein [Apilactobacillus apisilvae]|uniref:Type II secretion system F family protein n=1 Tax=Apilactobacillus apisilvae TaxID=2923364 RepID=A0ABY4PIG5_9LACO|nr:type II secretion system F family protein [Apilactobacillus apisilvae]UQS85212.1 type II secretion system F family protein [Apilactobacillus apisilvae]